MKTEENNLYNLQARKSSGTATEEILLHGGMKEALSGENAFPANSQDKLFLINQREGDLSAECSMQKALSLI